ncbi:hypothetical protein BGZ80_010288 [Entomortierella chlamydospora]|uniref:D-xylose 1-dehydrogenase (NADP(+), D-xylono-1,5-lactone-forming) n=1 Tax=Entomortierella chlamydospora TaxID=101097 RepID=A0A9P6N2T6_9FUNG|nr:hypothetical protein BGZ80_010288 [Entomortierella chlamydospora]
MASQKSSGLFARYRLSNPKQSVVKNAIGILGAANIAPPALVAPSMNMSSIIVVSVAARDENKAKAFASKHGIPNTHPSYDAIINDPNIDCIYNPLPNGLHYEWTKKALDAGKHVLLEKPSTSNAEQTRELFAIAKEKNLVLLEAFHYGFHPASTFFRETLQKHIASGHPLQRVKAVMSFPNLFPLTDIRFNYNLGGGITMDCGSCTINAIRYFTGFEVESVEKAVPKIVSEDIDGRMDAVLRLKRGDNTFAEAELNVSLTNPWFSIQTYREMMPTFTAETDDKIFFYHYFTVKNKATGKTENLPKAYGEGYSTYRYQLEAFVKAVENGGKDVESIPGWVSGEDSALNMTAIDAVYKKSGMKLRK